VFGNNLRFRSLMEHFFE